MKLRIHILFLCLVTMFTSFASASNNELSIKLQAHMQMHIQRHSVDGALIHFDTESAQIERLFPVDTHPMIMTIGDVYVLCVDAKNEQGKSLPVDFYITENNDSLVVILTEIDNRAPLKSLMQQGLVSRLK